MIFVHKPKNLQPLKIKRDEREQLESSSNVESLIDSKMLLSEDLNILMFEKLLKNHDEIISTLSQWEELFDAFKQSDDSLAKIQQFNESFEYLEKRAVLGGELESSNISLGDLMDEGKLDDILLEDFEVLNHGFREYIVTLTGELEEDLVEFEEEHRVGLNVLENANLSACNSCGAYLNDGRFKKTTCPCGKTINSSSDIERVNVKALSEEVERFLSQNLWFEHASAYLLRRIDYETKCGGYILGASGVEHEIDVLAEKPNTAERILCECKTSRPDESEIFGFSGKMRDIGCSEGLLFTLVPNEDIDDEIKSLARSNNIKIVGGVLEEELEELEGRILS